MKYGESFHIRLNPEDIMGCVDICKISNIPMNGMSLAMAIRLALSGLLESARAAELIPRRDGFEYTAMVQPLLATGRNGRKLQISNTIELAEVSRKNNDLPVSVVHIPQPVRASSARENFIRRYGARIDELNQKKELDIENFTVEEQDELNELIDKLNSV